MKGGGLLNPPTNTPRRLRASEKARLALAASVLTTVALYFIPGGRYVIYPLLLLSTLAHEIGHGVAAVLVGGSFERFVMYPDGSGVATWAGPSSRLAIAFVAAGGLVGPAVVAGVGFAAGRTAKGSRRALWVGVVLLALALLLVVRNVFGVVFVLVLGAVCLLVALRASQEVAQLTLLFLAVQLALSVYSRSSYLFTPMAETATGAMPSDVAQIEAALWLPYWFWGGLCGLFSLAVVVLGLRAFWRS